MNSAPENIRLLWAGEWPLWQTLVLSLILVLLAVWIYRSEVKRGTSGRLRWLLPTLRCLSLITIVLTLAGPVLQLQREEGNRGKITVFLDSSESMSLKDESYKAGRKILLAKEHGFLPEESDIVDYRFAQGSRKLEKLAEILRKTDTENTGKDELVRIQKEITSILKLLGEEKSTFSKLTKDNFLLEEVWLNLNGSNWEDLLNQKRYTDESPDQYAYLSNSETKRNTGDQYARRIKAFLNPPEDGDYIFWLYSDDSSVLKIAQPRSENFKNIIKVDSYTGSSWKESVRSEKIFLEKQKIYPIEIIHKEGSGDDFCAIGWTLPSGKEEKPINGKYFSAPLSPKDTPEEMEIQNQISKKFEAIFQSDPQDKPVNFENLAISAMELSIVLQEKFDDYAESLLKQNILALNEAMKNFEAFTRMERATQLLSHPKNGLLEEFRDTHLLEIRNLSENATEVLWDNFSESEQFDTEIDPVSKYTNLSDGILSSLRVEDQNKEENNIRGAAVLISDGGHNQENSPIQTAKLLAVRNLPIYTVGLGSDQKPLDLALLQTVVPDSVYQEDRIKGIISIKDNLTPGTAYSIRINDSEGLNVWEKSMVGMDVGIGQIAFDFPAKKVVEQRLADFSESEKEAIRTIPLSFKIEVEPIENEAETENNQLTFSIDASRRKNQMLIVDNRPRWETRYLNNLFERDDRWEVACVWGKPDSDEQILPRGEKINEFPISKEELLKFDLIVFGEIPTEEFSKEEQNWIVDFVTQRAGGILFIDGPRQNLRSYENKEKHPISALFPVTWKKNGPLRISPSSFVRPEEENRLNALTLDPIEERDEEIWKHLPLPAWISPVESLPGSDVYLEASTDGTDKNKSAKNTIPILTGRLVGAGKAFYMGFDETWRWRYEVADLYHQRFWNQLLSKVMERPFALNQDQLSMDVGGSAHNKGKAIPIRVRLRDKEGKTPEQPYPEVDALIWDEDEVIATVPLKGVESSNGLFIGEVFGLDANSYQMSVRAPGILDEMEFSEQKLPFEIKPGLNKEKNFLVCDENLLSEMAELSGGSYFREENFNELKEVLRPISSGRIIINEIILWQSYGWLIFVVFLLGLEMFLRKRAGML